MLEWFTLAESCYPHIAEVIELGKSYESRPLSIIKVFNLFFKTIKTLQLLVISTLRYPFPEAHLYTRYASLYLKIGKVQQHEKPAIWIDAGIHAREWIATSTAIYLIDKVRIILHRKLNY